MAKLHPLDNPKYTKILKWIFEKKNTAKLVKQEIENEQSWGSTSPARISQTFRSLLDHNIIRKGVVRKRTYEFNPEGIISERFKQLINNNQEHYDLYIANSPIGIELSKLIVEGKSLALSYILETYVRAATILPEEKKSINEILKGFDSLMIQENAGIFLPQEYYDNSSKIQLMMYRELLFEDVKKEMKRFIDPIAQKFLYNPTDFKVNNTQESRKDNRGGIVDVSKATTISPQLMRQIITNDDALTKIMQVVSK